MQEGKCDCLLRIGTNYVYVTGKCPKRKKISKMFAVEIQECENCKSPLVGSMEKCQIGCPKGKFCCQFCGQKEGCENRCFNNPTKCGQYYHEKEPKKNQEVREKKIRKDHSDPTAEAAIGRTSKKKSRR